jgi:hypothetical protein
LKTKGARQTFCALSEDSNVDGKELKLEQRAGTLDWKRYGHDPLMHSRPITVFTGEGETLLLAK